MGHIQSDARGGEVCYPQLPRWNYAVLSPVRITELLGLHVIVHKCYCAQQFMSSHLLCKRLLLLQLNKDFVTFPI